MYVAYDEFGIQHYFNHTCDYNEALESGRYFVQEPSKPGKIKKYFPDITLLCIDCVNLERLFFPINYSTRFFRFNTIKILTSIAPEYKYPYIKIPHIDSLEKYSEFCVKELYKYVDTKYCILIQWDGFIIGDTSTWKDEFLNYDYIGAPWWYNDGMNVGNGGFSLRSKRILEEVSKIAVGNYHPEDNVYCRNYFSLLKEKGIIYAPEELATFFSIEGSSKYKESKGRFGFHRFASYPGIEGIIEHNKHMKEKLMIEE